MSGPADGGIAARLAAADDRPPRALGELVDRLRDRLADVVLTGGTGDGDRAAAAATTVRGVTNDSRTAAPGSLFVAVPGAHVDGGRFIDSAAAAGAVAAIVVRPDPAAAIPQVVVPDARRALAEAAAWWYGDPSRELAVVGITGTDGKTTTTLLGAAAFEAAGIPAGVVGTVVTQLGGMREANAEHATTPEAPQLQRALRAMVDGGDRVALIETTSHGLALERVAAVGYDVAILTNLSHEHLELHGTFEAYRAAKRRLFEALAADRNPPKPGVRWPRTGIVNADDPSAATFIEATRAAGAGLMTFGRSAQADVRLLAATPSAVGLDIRFAAADREAHLHLRLRGRFNAWNALAVVALGQAIGLDPAATAAGLEGLASVPGRMEEVVRGQPFRVVVDYAHTPASLELVLDELGPDAAAAGGGLIAVFGSAGERDRAKRPLMGRVAAERCRVVVVTDEDPRGEDRRAILAEIARGARAAIPRPEAILEIPDRRAAIRAAFDRAAPGDIVVLAGKGHETTILGPDRAEPWTEAGEAAAALAAMGWSG